MNKKQRDIEIALDIQEELDFNARNWVADTEVEMDNDMYKEQFLGEWKED